MLIIGLGKWVCCENDVATVTSFLGEVGCTIAELLAKAQVDRLILLDDGLVETKSSRFGKDCIGKAQMIV